MITADAARELVGAPMLDDDGVAVGRIRRIYLGQGTGRPRFAVVDLESAPSDGTEPSQRFVPLIHPATDVGPEHVRVPWPVSAVRAAPDLEDAGHLSPADEQALLDHYRATLAEPTDPTDAPDGGPVMVRSEERLTVTTRWRPVGRARLRRFTTTEMVTVTLPVRREYAVLEVAGYDDETYASVADRPDDRDDPEGPDVVLLAEEVAEVVTTRHLVARARLEVRTRSTDRVVTGSVRTERITVDDTSTARPA